MIFLVLFQLGTLLCGAAVSSKMLIIGRAVAGLGGSGMMGGLMIPPAFIPNEKSAAHLGVMLGCKPPLLPLEIPSTGHLNSGCPVCQMNRVK
jgi:hypothetical protein